MFVIAPSVFTSLNDGVLNTQYQCFVISIQSLSISLELLVSVRTQSVQGRMSVPLPVIIFTSRIKGKWMYK
jgi:hypothetical protein